MVDTCAGEFPSATPYLYSSYDDESEAPRTGRRSVVILGSGPNRIGQGVEFDYCCVRAVDGAPGAGIRDDHDQLESRDRLDRLRHLGQAVLRAADAGGRARGRAPRGADGRDRAAGRADAAQAHPAARGGGGPDSRHVARCDRHRRGPEALRADRAGRSGSGSRRTAPHQRRRGGRGRRPHRLSRFWCARRTCWAAGRCRSCTTSHPCATTSRPRRG